MRYEDPSKDGSFQQRLVTPETPEEHLPAFLTIREVCLYTRLSKNTIYDAVRSGRIESRQFAKRKTLIPRSALCSLEETRAENGRV